MMNTISLSSPEVIPKKLNVHYCDAHCDYHLLEPCWQMEHVHRYYTHIKNEDVIFPYVVMEFSL